MSAGYRPAGGSLGTPPVGGSVVQFRNCKCAEAVSVPRTSRPLCAVCHQEHCNHSDLEYAGIVPVRERVA